MTDTIDISGLDRVELLLRLWTNMKPAAFFAMSGRPSPSFDESAAKKVVGDYIDYFQGRAIKTDLSKDEVNPRLYDRDAGSGTFKRVVESMRK